jgi:hypothetical protein
MKNFVNVFLNLVAKPLGIIFKKILAGIAHNVPAVYDVLAARIRKCAAFPGPTKCGGGFVWEWRSHDLAKPEPEGPLGPEAYTVLLCAVPSAFVPSAL